MCFSIFFSIFFFLPELNTCSLTLKLWDVVYVWVCTRGFIINSADVYTNIYVWICIHNVNAIYVAGNKKLQRQFLYEIKY